MVKCRTFLTILAVLIAIFYTFIPNLTHDNDITPIERVANFVTWTIIAVDHFIHCTLQGQIYYSVDFNENRHSVAEYAFYFAEKVRLWAHANELEKWRNDRGGRNYDMWTIEASELFALPDQNSRIKLFQEKTQNYQKPVIIKHWANKSVLSNWHLDNLAKNYSNEEVSVRQWEEGCELGHIDKTYRKSLNCEMHNQNLKITLDNMLGNNTYKYGLAHTIVGHQSDMQKHIFDDFNIIEAFKLFTVFNSSYIPSFVPDIITNGLLNIGNKIVKYLPSDFQKMRINMFDEMTAFFATPTYWYQSVKKYRPEELLQAKKELEFVRRQGAQLHNAFLGNIFANVEGRKLWLFISPEYSAYLRGMSASYGFATFTFFQHYLFKDHFGLNASNFSNVDGYYNKNKKDYEKFRDSLFNQEYQVVNPNGTYEEISKYSSFEHLRSVYETIPKYEILLEEGDILYFPPFWWHCVKNYESPDSDIKNYEHSMNFAIANRLIFAFKALEVNYFDWFHSVFLFSFKQFKNVFWGVEVNMPKTE